MTTHIYDMSNFLRLQFETGQSMEDIALDFAQRSNNKNDRQILVFDGYKSSQYRKDIYPEYKGKRPPNSELSEFFTALNHFKESYIPLIGCVVVDIPYFEADDVIAYYARNLAGEIHIHSTDKDFLVLTTNPLVKCISKFAPNLPCDLSELRLFKTLVGDSSDNIRGVVKFGEKAYQKLTPLDRQALVAGFESDAESAPQLLGITPKLQEALNQQWSVDLKAFWHIIGFREDVAPLIPQHLKAYKNAGMQAIMAVSNLRSL